MPKLVRALSFRAALDQKLVTIVRAFGSASEGARQCGVDCRTFRRWRAAYPTTPLLQKVDDVYAMAVEILNDPELLKKRRKTSKEIASLSRKLKLSEECVRLLKAEGLY
jgi:hypothetical protein